MITLKQLYDYLEIPDKVIEELANLNISNRKYLDELFFTNEDKFFKVLEQFYRDNYLVNLYLYLNYALILYDIYQQNNINESVFFDTISDIKIWCEECVKETGVYGIKEIYWLNEHLHSRIYRLGRLQFQKTILPDELIETMKGKDFDAICNVHIPRGGAITKEEVTNSFEKAKQFFGSKILYLCESWLLSPKLKAILNPNSNIIAFQDLFTVYDYHENSKSIHRYLEKGSKLEKNISDYETQNGNIGVGFGYYLP